MVKKIARKCGYFNTGKNFELLVPYYSDIYDSLFDTLWKYFEKPTINNLTTFMYYPGAFTHFHEGHLDVVKQAYNFISQRTDNFYIVLSPANSDYIKYKYPDLNIINKSRYELILKSLQTLDKDILSKIIIDLNPMLNMDRDYNFTDLLNNFVTIYGACYHKGPHYIICGKDKNFKILEQYTDKIKIFYGEMKIEKHSKDLNIYPITIEYKKGYKFDTFKDTDVYFIQDQKSKYLDFSNHNFVSTRRKDLESLEHIINFEDSNIEEIQHQSNYQYMYHLLFTIAQAKNAITIGTTNLDEISYIGWFGKNSDMCVDLQFIADFHKFEIDYLLKSYSITIADVPKGDLYSGLSDEEVFNTSYLDLAYYSYCKCKDLPISLNPTLENLHTKNHHKYMGQTFNPYFIKDDDYFIYQGNS